MVSTVLKMPLLSVCTLYLLSLETVPLLGRHLLCSVLAVDHNPSSSPRAYYHSLFPSVGTCDFQCFSAFVICLSPLLFPGTSYFFGLSPAGTTLCDWILLVGIRVGQID